MLKTATLWLVKLVYDGALLEEVSESVVVDMGNVMSCVDVSITVDITGCGLSTDIILSVN